MQETRAGPGGKQALAQNENNIPKPRLASVGTSLCWPDALRHEKFGQHFFRSVGKGTPVPGRPDGLIGLQGAFS